MEVDSVLGVRLGVCISDCDLKVELMGSKVMGVLIIVLNAYMAWQNLFLSFLSSSNNKSVFLPPSSLMFLTYFWLSDLGGQ